MDKRYQVFVSSTYNDLIDERKEATQAILKCNCFPAGMELFPASNKKQWNVIKQVIDDSDFYLLILAGRYGSLGVDDFGKKVGYTEMEFDYALSKGKPIIVMLHRHPEELPARLTEKKETNKKRLEKFREKAMDGRMVAFWENKDQLNGEILSSLHKMISGTPDAVGWIKADSIPDINSATDFEAPRIINSLKAIYNTDDKIRCLAALNARELNECFKYREIIGEFAGLISINQTSDVICETINLLLRKNLDYDVKDKLKQSLDLKSLFLEQCKEGKVRDSELAVSIVNFLDMLMEYSTDYSAPILEGLKAGSIASDRKSYYMGYIADCGCYAPWKEEGQDLINYIVREINNPQRVLSISDLAFFLTGISDDEDEFVEIYNVFVNVDKPVQRKIINSIFENCGANYIIVTPRIQRMFFEICEMVLAWDDDCMKAEWLLYCLFTRTYDIFTVDEIFDKVEEFNDDVFYMFYWQLSNGEFYGGAEEYYSLHDNDIKHIRQIIEERKHPRGNKLLERF